MLSKHLNLAIVDDRSLFRQILKSYLSEQKNITVSFDGSEILDLSSMLKGNSIDLLLVHLEMPNSNGNNALRLLRAEYPTLKILIISMNDDIESVSELMEAGINGYISKSDRPEDLLSAIQMVSEDHIYHNSTFTETLDWHRQKDIKVFRSKSSTFLNAREKKVLQLIWEEKSNKEIAGELFLGVKSIEKIRQDIKEKTGVKSTIGLLKYAISKKIIKGNPDTAANSLDRGA
jgi:DNA-binding NarL/FixJ family response regulator